MHTRPWLRYAWWVLGLAVLAEAIHEIFEVGGPESIYVDWIHDGILIASAGLVLMRAAVEPEERAAWIAFGAGLASWAIGETLWSVVYGDDATPPYPTVADAWWLTFYPLTILGIALLIRRRVVRFELHRWMDGLVVVLVVITPMAVLLLQPIAKHSHDTAIVTAIDFSYPILDLMLVGAILGVYGLLGWRPGRTWLVLGLGVTAMAFADALFAVQQARGAQIDDDYDFVWPLGAVLIAVAAWSTAPGAGADEEVYGWRAIALPLTAQVCGILIQAYELVVAPGAAGLVTMVILVIATTQIVISRPRSPAAAGEVAPAGS